MRKELPQIFKKSVDSTHTHNKKVYYGSEINQKENVKIIKNNIKNDSFSVEDKIRKLFKSSRYIFNINVLIKTDKKDYDTKIAGKVKNSLVTVDNEVIPIIEINDIIIKDQI